MQLSIGYDSFAKRKGEHKRVVIDTEQTHNAHILFMGMSGSGKTHNLRSLISQMRDQGNDDLRVHIYDVHGDIDIEDAETIRFSEISNFGINPFILNTDLHDGGVRKRIQAFIKIIRKTSFVLGDKQEAAIRNILMDVYSAKGFSATDPDTWSAAIPTDDDYSDPSGIIFLEVPFAEKDEAKALGARWSSDPKGWYIQAANYKGEITRWSPRKSGTAGNRTYPTLKDVVDATNEKIREVFFGTGSRSIKAINAFSNASSKFNAVARQGRQDEEWKDKLDRSAESLREAVEEYIDNAMDGGRSVDDILKYGSLDILKSVGEKMENLLASGIFKNRAIEFSKHSVVHHYHIKSLSDDEQKMFVLLDLERKFEEAKARGPCNYIRDVFVIDEAAKFFDDDESNILNIMAREARKFGVSMICASQAPTHFSDDFISSVAVKIILGIDEMFWDSSVRKLRVPIDDMKWVKPKELLLAQIKQQGRSSWQQVSCSA